MKLYSELLQSSKDIRETHLVETVGGLVAAKEAASEKRPLAKLLTAMVKGGDCKDGEMNEVAEKITGHNIRKKIQGVYELVVVFTAIVDGKITLTEEQFDTLEPSKLGLLSPFIGKPEYADKLDEAIAAVVDGKSATKIRELKGGEKKEPKAVKEQRERADKLEKEIEAYKEREAAMVKVAFACTDIPAEAAILTSGQVRSRIRQDLEMAEGKGDSESLEFQVEKLGQMFFAAATFAGIDPLEILAELAGNAAKSADGNVVEVPATIEHAAAA